MYPLTESYEGPILEFIERLRRHAGLEVRVNSMSTRVFGPYELLCRVVSTELGPFFESRSPKMAVVMKWINADLRQEPTLDV